MSKSKPKSKAVSSYVKHSDHSHPQTKAASAKCRRVMVKTGEPWDGTDGTTLTRGQKAARTRAANRAAREQAEAVDTLLDETAPRSMEEVVEESEELADRFEAYDGEGPHRNSKGRFTRNTLEQWQTLLDNIEGAQAYLVDNGADLVEARLTTHIGGQTFVATFDGHEWAVEAK